MRAITGCADGKLRIWNILNGDCIRCVRGNSRSDSITSLSIVGQRLLLNTENNIILLEFEPIIYEYNVENLIDNSFVDTSDNPKFNQKMVQKRKSYPMIRANRMELVSTTNARVFNDNRTTVIEHSSRPISGKCLQEAKKIYSAVNGSGNFEIFSPYNFRTNSAGHISEAALVKRRSIMESINAIISSQGSHPDSNMSNYKTDIINKVGFLETNQNSNRTSEFEMSRVKRPPANLNETKQYLRDQLREIKEAGQSGSPSSKTDSSSLVPTSYRYNSNNKVSSSSIRPTSSPSRVNTKKIKLKAHQFMKRLEGYYRNWSERKIKLM